MCPSGAICLPADWVFLSVSLYYKNPTKCVGLVQNRHHYHLIEYKLFTPWYSSKIAHLTLNNNQSLILLLVLWSNNQIAESSFNTLIYDWNGQNELYIVLLFTPGFWWSPCFYIVLLFTPGFGEVRVFT